MKSAILLIFISILILKCTPTYNYYHSTSDIPRRTYYNKSVLHLIKPVKDFKYLFGVAASCDYNFTQDSAHCYALFAPTNTYRPDEIDDLNLQFSVNLSLKELDYFISVLDSTVSYLDLQYSDTVGTVFKFESIPENKETQVSKNVVEYIPSLRYYFQRFRGNSKAFLSFGPNEYQFYYRFSEKSDLLNLVTLLEDTKRELILMSH